MIRLRPADLDRLAGWAEAAYPQEACALLAGRPRPCAVIDLTRLEASRNLAAAPDRAFEVDLGLRIGLERDLRERPDAGDHGAERLVGLWHSHPDGPAMPSERDRLAVQEDLLWLVTSVRSGRACQTRAFRPLLGPGRPGPRHRIGGFRPVAGFQEEALVVHEQQPTGEDRR
ncbi:MAG: Mov34/MPN/PAD-1 family protein [Sneathiellaceae bacterium]